MYELHKNEQYFFDTQTLEHLASFLSKYNSIGVLCAPLLEKALADNKKTITLLDINERFYNIPGFLHWDIYKPQRLPQKFDIIICDLPFFNVSLSQLFKAIGILSHYDVEQKLLISYLHRRGNAFISTFSPFGLESTSFYPGYVTVKKIDKNKIEFFGNLGNEVHTSLSNQFLI
jgi:hypothetical protein